MLSGKAEVMIAGFDNIKEGSYKFANMKATGNSNTETEFAIGREPAEMSRPTMTTHTGVRVLLYLHSYS
jgi:fatty acid synthase subunit alpha, fungi type